MSGCDHIIEDTKKYCTEEGLFEFTAGVREVDGTIQTRWLCKEHYNLEAKRENETFRIPAGLSPMKLVP